MAFMTKVLSDVQSREPQRRRGWKDRPVCNIILSQRDSPLLFFGQCIPDKWLMQYPFGKTELQCSWSSVAWIKLGTSCVVVKIKILKSIGKFEQTEIMCCITLHLSTMWAAPVWSQSKPTQRKSHWKNLQCSVALRHVLRKYAAWYNCCARCSACCLWNWAHVLYMKFWKHPWLLSNLNERLYSIFRTDIPWFFFLVALELFRKHSLKRISYEASLWRSIAASLALLTPHPLLTQEDWLIWSRVTFWNAF